MEDMHTQGAAGGVFLLAVLRTATVDKPSAVKTCPPTSYLDTFCTEQKDGRYIVLLFRRFLRYPSGLLFIFFLTCPFYLFLRFSPHTLGMAALLKELHLLGRQATEAGCSWAQRA
jgi:hypothetical protein